MSETITAKTRTITLTDAQPVKIIEHQWPEIAHGNWGDNPAIPSQSNRGADIRVRQHADGRAIVYGTRWSRWQGEGGRAGGEMLDAGADIVAAIRRVAEDVGISEVAVRECIADLPAVEI